MSSPSLSHTRATLLPSSHLHYTYHYSYCIYPHIPTKLYCNYKSPLLVAKVYRANILDFDFDSASRQRPVPLPPWCLPSSLLYSSIARLSIDRFPGDLLSSPLDWLACNAVLCSPYHHLPNYLRVRRLIMLQLLPRLLLRDY